MLHQLARPRWWQAWASIFLYLPAILLISYFVLKFDDALKVYEVRDFTMQERLLTQTRILWDYVSKILLLKLHDFGLFHDDFPLSHTLLQPISTVFAIVGLFGSVIAALIWRKRYPVFAFSVLWFLAGHLMESGHIGLMLYFEHRNYLPAFGILFALACGAVWLINKLREKPTYRLAIAGGSLWMLSLVPLTWLQTDIWGKPLEQALYWAEKHPRSSFALTSAAITTGAHGHLDRTVFYYEQLLEVKPNKISSWMLYLVAECLRGESGQYATEYILEKLQSGKADASVADILDWLIKRYFAGQCQTFQVDTVDSIFIAVSNNANLSVYHHDFLKLYAHYIVAKQHYGQAAQLAAEALELKFDPDLFTWRVYWLVEAGELDTAKLALLQLNEKLKPWQRPVYQADLKQLEELIDTTRRIQQQIE